MSQKPSITALETARFLQDKFGSETAELQLLRGGEWSQAYSFRHANQKYVLRWSNSAENFERDALAASYCREGLPIPQMTDMGEKLGKYYAISQFARGDFIDTLAASDLNNALPALFGLFDALRGVDLSRTTGYGGWDKNGRGDNASWKEYLLAVKDEHAGGLTHGWYASLAGSVLGTAIFNQVYAQFEAVVDKCPENRELIHSDLLNFNLLMADNKVSAVIDWGCSLYGDSLYDLAWFIFYAPWYPQFEEIQLCQRAVEHFKSSSADQVDREARLLCYQLHIGLGSIAYNAFKKDWKAAQVVADYTLKLSRRGVQPPLHF